MAGEAADVGFEIEAVKLIASLRLTVDDQEKRIRHLEKLLFDMALPRAVEPSEPITNTGMGRHGAMGASQRHPSPGCGCESGYDTEGPKYDVKDGAVVAAREPGTVETEKEEE